MFIRPLVLLLSLLLVAPCFAGQNDNYPFTVESEPEGDGHRIVARNNGPAPVSVKVALLYSVYATPDRRFPVFAVVPPNGGVLYLGRFKRTMSGVGYSFRYQSSWMLGDLNARQSPDALYRLPFRDGSAYRIGQAPGGPITTHHSPGSAYAVDIGMPQDVPVLATRDGTVIYTEANQKYGGKSPDLLDKANEVRIQHADGTIAVYAHLAHGGVYVYPGQRVRVGEQIGLVGSTGYSSGPHLHFAVQKVVRNGDELGMESLPFQFYVGNPPAAFFPQFGVLARADYSSPGRVPGTTAETRGGASPSAGPTSGIVSAPVSEALISLEVPAQIRSYLRAIPAWQWFAGMVGLVVSLLLLDKRRTARRQRDAFVFREPSMRGRPAAEPVFHGLSAWDKLIVVCGGDRKKAERLMEYEYRKAPSISNDEAALRAWERLQRDRR
ncbi:M23 family metallopeptidase [Aromatoleum diolicum]|uniref:Peptidoglycan DD-metalloendopeptidase family protein n=1 Tax=Aromatoleum diolicum TaxID=75796 RepID=A0ABX1QCC4_9RHOO|nr:M23 family metallopeptidase [Aromatoleum diolicum]NMG74755.1 peptidoglycan DD-metalloendopeptidase family protein [Aromatoleum diolicum]